MARPQPPRLTPITRAGMNGAMRLIPSDLLLDQVIKMDRLGTWHLAQAVALQEGFDDGTAEENKYNVNRLQRHLQLAGALLGSINSRLSTYKFVKEVRDGQHGEAGKDDDGYYKGA